MKLNRGILVAGTLLLAVSLTACSLGNKGAGKPENTSAVVEQTESPAPEILTLEGTLNLVDEGQGYLVVVNSDGAYCRFLIGETDITGFQPGDKVEVSYTGTISSEDDESISAELVSIRQM